VSVSVSRDLFGFKRISCSSRTNDDLPVSVYPKCANTWLSYRAAKRTHRRTKDGEPWSALPVFLVELLKFGAV
jgi:hypothetical protein